MKAADLVLRPATLDDARFYADLWTANAPDDPLDPPIVRGEWELGDPTATIERFVAERDGTPTGFALQRHPSWEKLPERYGRIGADLLPDARTPRRLDALYAAMEARSREQGARTFATWIRERDDLALGVLAARGYREERRQRHWELDLAAERERIARMTAESRERMRGEGIRVTTVDRDDDPEKWRKLWRMSNEAVHDIPSTVPHVDDTFEDFMRWMASPGVHHDRVWVARQGDDILGVSLLSYPVERGVVQTDWTGVARAGRGRGVARALKCETVTQAIALGVERVRTDNDSQNAPILHINETMGYRPRPGSIQLMRAAG